MTVGVERFSAAPAQTGPLLAAVGVDGTAFTVTAVVAVAGPHPLVMVTLYVPVAAVVAAAIDGL